MPMKPGTKPNVRDWMNVYVHHLHTAVNRFATKNKKQLIFQTEGNYTKVLVNLGGQTTQLLARMYEHKRSTQALISAALIEYLPKDEEPGNTDEGTRKPA